MYFDIYGPFEIAREGRRVASSQIAMWGKARAASERAGYGPLELETAIGCYAFGVRRGQTLKPWYVGMTLAKDGFRAETFQAHKRAHYNQVTTEHPGTPVLFLMPLLTPEGRFSRDRGSNRALVKWVEKMLFGVALKQNPDCRNQRDTRFLRHVEVRGVFNSRQPGPAGATVSAVRQMFGAERS